MGRFIVKLEGRYLEWSSVSDGPTTYGMTLPELRAYVREEEGAEGLRRLEDRLLRVERKGTSAHRDESADDTIYGNRAGPGETRLHREEIVEFYVRRREDPTPEALAAFRAGLPACGPDCPAVERNGCSGFCPRCWGTGLARPERKP